MSTSDEAVQLTNNDASTFKAYAVSKGYWQDPYIGYFSAAAASQKQPNEHRPPEMSRGYFARVNAIHSIVHKFLDKHSAANEKCQIVNLGAGYDTLYFNLLDQNKLPHKYVEVDFQRIVQSKCRLIRSKKALADKLQLSVPKPAFALPAAPPAVQEGAKFVLPSLPPPMTSGGASMNEIHAGAYNLVPADLRNVKDIERKLVDSQIDFKLPTLVITECVLVYMKLEDSVNLLKYLTGAFDKCCFVNYEQTNLSDRFGEIMLENMEARSCKLLGVDACKSNGAQVQRLVECNFDKSLCQCITLTEYYKSKMDKRERGRIESLEFLDESELLMQLLDHYCVCYAANNSCLGDIGF